MNLLVDHLPDAIQVRGIEVPINTDFRASILYNLAVDRQTKPEDVLRAAVLHYVPDIPIGLICQELFEKLNEFYLGGKNEAQKKQAERLKGLSNGKPGYSFELDADLIHAAFMGQYGIDLNTVEYLHWWKFMTLFGGLNDSCEIVKIIGYRTMKLDSKMSMEQRKYYKNLQQRYALPSRQKKPAEIREMEQMLVAGTWSG